MEIDFDFTSVETKKMENNQIEGRFGKTARFLLNAKPFRLDLFTNDIFVVSVNSKNMFNFEHYRNKPGYDEISEEKLFLYDYLELREPKLILR